MSAPDPSIPTAPQAEPVLRHRLLHVVARRCLNPLVVRLGGAGGRFSPTALVFHAGRRTGHMHATPLAVQIDGDKAFICLTYGPATRWCQNILAAGECRVRLRGREFVAVEPRIVARDELPPRLRRRYALVRMPEFFSLTIADSADRPRQSGEPHTIAWGLSGQGAARRQSRARRRLSSYSRVPRRHRSSAR